MPDNVTELGFTDLLLSPQIGPEPERAELARPLPKEAQKGGFLCWAAVAVSVAKFYAPESTLTQCGLVNEVKLSKGELAVCCPDPQGEECDRPEDMSVALTVSHNFASVPPGSLTFDLVRDQLVQARPVVVVKSIEAEIHAMVIFRASRNPATAVVALEVFDPLAVDLVDTRILNGNEGEFQVVCLTQP